MFGDNAVHNSNVTWQGDGRKAASHPEGSGLTFSPVLKRLLPPKASAEGGLYLNGNWLVTMERV